MTELTRLNKFIRETGVCSRREADKYIEEGRVTVNGKTPELGTKVSVEDDVRIDGNPINKKEAAIYIAFNKPAGIICTTERDIKHNIIDYINYPTRIFPIGRLDRASEGLIFLTNDGDIVNKILRAGNNHEKEYLVTVDKSITETFIRRMGNGIPILETVTKKCFVEQTGKFQFRIILTQGMNRQIRKMCSFLEYEVKSLRRFRIMNITLEGLKEGSWREFTKQEIETVEKLISNSSKTEPLK
jgi:23S rRNA pseudouridine2604 synthase